MDKFFIRFISLTVILASVFIYNGTIENRKQEEKNSELEFKLKHGQNYSESEQESGRFTDGEYEGSAKGFGGDIKVQVVVENGNISKVNILSADGEDNAYLESAKGIIDDILAAQSADVDTVSGATFSSTGIKNAAKEAIGKAEK